jgi:hypothetical protein
MSLVEHKENYNTLPIWLEYIAICEGGEQSSYCKGALLGILEQQIAISRINNQGDYITLSLPQWTKLAMEIYSKQIIARCLTELVEDQLIQRRAVVINGSDTYEYTLNVEKINALIKELPESLFDGHLPQPAEPELPAYTQHLSIAIPADEWKSTGDQSGKVHGNNLRAMGQGLPGTLTVSQWLETIDYYQHKCAICQTRHYQVLEHFIPLALGLKGTTADNCIPACSECNRVKGNLHPLMLPESLGLFARMMEIQAYLETREEVVEDE